MPEEKKVSFIYEIKVVVSTGGGLSRVVGQFCDMVGPNRSPFPSLADLEWHLQLLHPTTDPHPGPWEKMSLKTRWGILPLELTLGEIKAPVQVGVILSREGALVEQKVIDLG